MPTSTPEKITASRALSTSLYENAGLFLWLIKLFISNKISMSLVQWLLRSNGITSNFIEYIEAISDEAIQSNTDTQRHLMLLGVRALTIQAVVTPSSIEAAYKAPLREQFRLVSALLDGYGNLAFIHRPEGFFEEDKAAFRTALFNGKKMLCSKIKDYLDKSLENNEEWEKIPVLNMVRRMTFMIFAEIYLGIDTEHILAVYEPLTEALDVFERMWQHPDEFNPFVMFVLYQRLNRISNELHEHRQPAELPDGFARRYHRSMNVTAIFLVASNLVHFLTAAILYECTHSLDPVLSEQQLDDSARKIATRRFVDSRIWRVDDGIFYSNAPDYEIAGQVSLPRSITVIPQGDINHHRMTTNTHLRDDGDVKEPELFGRGRPCPGSAISYAAVKSVLFAVATKRVVFVPNEAQQEKYKQFVEDRTNWQHGREGSEEPPVTGKWVRC